MCRGTSEKLKRKRLHNYILLNLLLAFFLAVGIHELLIQEGYARLNENTAAGDGFGRTMHSNRGDAELHTEYKRPGRKPWAFIGWRQISGQTR